MKVSGFTFLRNAVINGYPFEESIRSILPVIDEFVCVVGESSDETRDRVLAINDPRIKIVDSRWNESMSDRGFVYGQQKMIAQFNCTGDWAFYLEGDEVLHEAELSAIREAMLQNLMDKEVEALYFDFYHFYGTPDQYGVAGYRRAPRIIRNSIRSIAPDGLFWVVLDKNKKGRYPRAKHVGAHIYHYGHCRNVAAMAQKLDQVGKYWGRPNLPFLGYGQIDTAELRVFDGSHPKVMENWLSTKAELVFSQDPAYRLTGRNWRNRIRFWVETKLGVEISKKHYRALD
ncbi:glycosyltransferase [Litoricolaceae bacterium]|nr:glycosyltransferase [Litorivicinaceae bacterium]